MPSRAGVVSGPLRGEDGEVELTASGLADEGLVGADADFGGAGDLAGDDDDGGGCAGDGGLELAQVRDGDCRASCAASGSIESQIELLGKICWTYPPFWVQ